MTKENIARVHYFERQFLRAEDFTDEQAYHLAMRRRHNIAHHSWGIVQGLRLGLDSLGNPCVQPGVAVDGYGRELILPEQRPLPLAAFADKDSDQLDVWLEYDRLGTETPPQGYLDCGADPTGSPYRWEEKPLLRLTVPDPAKTDRRNPEAVPAGDRDFGPTRLPPDDPQRDWPVFLGQVERARQSPDKPYAYSFDLEGRPYAGLVGESVVAPSGRACVRIGMAPTDEQSSEQSCFAVFLKDAGEECTQARMSIDDQGTVDVRGETRLHGDLTVNHGTIAFKEPFEVTVGEEGLPDPDVTAPWRIYGVEKTDKIQKAGTAGATRTVDDQGEVPTQDLKTRELRIEMGSGGSINNQVVIGAWSEEKKAFCPCLTLYDDGKVRVHGNLIVNGQLTEVQKSAGRALRGEARVADRNMTSSGTVSTSALLPNLANPTDTSKRSFVSLVKALMLSPDGRSAIAKALQDSGDITDQLKSKIGDECWRKVMDALESVN